MVEENLSYGCAKTFLSQNNGYCFSLFLSLFAEIITKESSFTLSGVKILHVCIDHSIKTSTVLLRGTIGF